MTRSSDRRVEIRRDPLLTEKLVYSVGPQHPSLPSPLELRVQADGELIERITPEVGFMHRGVEQLVTQRNYAQAAGLLSRCEWLAGSNADWLVADAIERIEGITIPARAQWLRTLVLELSRIGNHLFWFGNLGLEAGAYTPIFISLREREMLLDLLEMLSGHRHHHGWIVPGGVRTAPPEDFSGHVRAFCLWFQGRLDEYEDFFSDNAIWINRSELIGTLEPEFAFEHGATGPVLRGSGIAHDLRRDQPYAMYGELDLHVPTGEYGDVLDRYRVRFLEMRESLRIIEACLGNIGGDTPLRDPDVNPDPEALTVSRGEVYTAVESPRGELGLTLVSDGTNRPNRMHLRAPSLYHLFLLDELCRGYLLADLFVIYGSLDIMIGEVDK